MYGSRSDSGVLGGGSDGPGGGSGARGMGERCFLCQKNKVLLLPPGQVQDLQEHLQDVQEQLQGHFQNHFQWFSVPKWSDRPSDRLKSSKIHFVFNGVGPIFCAVKATILGHILAPFGVKLVGF